MLQCRNSGIPRFSNSGIREFRKGQSKRIPNETEIASTNLVFSFSVVVSSVGLFPPRFVKKHEKTRERESWGNFLIDLQPLRVGSCLDQQAELSEQTGVLNTAELDLSEKVTRERFVFFSIEKFF